jgi:hypothetical protein
MYLDLPLSLDFGFPYRLSLAQHLRSDRLRLAKKLSTLNRKDRSALCCAASMNDDRSLYQSRALTCFLCILSPPDDSSIDLKQSESKFKYTMMFACKFEGDHLRCLVLDPSISVKKAKDCHHELCEYPHYHGF